jgi:NAD(P)-dependent dehydrogenase (short-subunit alcohol dehydrogenase family)
MKLEGRIAIVTGSGGGFGEGIAKHFAELGANVLVADIRCQEAERVAAEINATGRKATPTSRKPIRSLRWLRWPSAVLEGWTFW